MIIAVIFFSKSEQFESGKAQLVINPTVWQWVIKQREYVIPFIFDCRIADHGQQKPSLEIACG